MGPYETSREAADAVRHIYDRSLESRHSSLRHDNRRQLDTACDDTALILGAYDREILAWLAGWEPETCLVIAGLICRAYAQGAAAMVVDGGVLTPSERDYAAANGAGPDKTGELASGPRLVGNPRQLDKLTAETAP